LRPSLHGWIRNVFYLSTNAKGCNVTATYRAYKKGALFANPCYTQIHPTCIPVSGDYQSKLTLMSESLRNDGRVWVPKKKGDNRAPQEIPDEDATTISSGNTRASATSRRGTSPAAAPRKLAMMGAALVLADSASTWTS
jgi:succinate dehydrogenase/fumarate reductase flavoprotein subunit